MWRHHNTGWSCIKKNTFVHSEHDFEWLRGVFGLWETNSLGLIHLRTLSWILMKWTIQRLLCLEMCRYWIQTKQKAFWVGGFCLFVCLSLFFKVLALFLLVTKANSNRYTHDGFLSTPEKGMGHKKEREHEGGEKENICQHKCWCCLVEKGRFFC